MTTYGLSLPVIVEFLYEKGYEIDWMDLYKDSQKEGWFIHNLMPKIEEAFVDSGHKELWPEIEKRLKHCIGKVSNN